MNDFTKGELEFFVQSMGYHEWHHNGPLITKVQSMIDSYCEHEEKETVQIPAAKSIFQNRCKKCRRLV